MSETLNAFIYKIYNQLNNDTKTIMNFHYTFLGNKISDFYNQKIIRIKYNDSINYTLKIW